MGHALTGSIAIAGALTLVEALVNTVAHDFFDRWWTRGKARAALRLRGLHPLGEIHAAWARDARAAS